MTPAPAIAVDQTQLHARAAVYRLLGRLWLRELDAVLLHELRSSPLQEAFVASGGVLPTEGADADTLSDLAIDYCQLFLGPREHLPPHQSVWTDGHFQSEATVAMRAEYRALDLPLPNGMPDHLGEQLTTMAVILERLAAECTVTASDLNAGQRFYRQCLAWPDDLCKLAADRAQTTFYRSVMTMTQDFLTEECAAWLAAD